MQRNKLLILGGGALNVFSIKEANENGFETYVADKNPSSPGFEFAFRSLIVDIIDPKTVYESVKDIGITGIVSMAEAGIATKAWLDDKLGLKNGLSITAANNATSKASMRALWQQIPEYSVPFFVVDMESAATDAVKKLNSFPLIVKPDKSFGGSRGVSKIRSVDEIKTAFEFASSSSFNKKVVIEQCAEGEEYSCEVLVYNSDTSVLAIGRKIKSPYPYRVDYSVQYPAPLDEDQQALVKDMCHKAIHLLGIENGVGHVEFAYTSEGPKLFEIGARCGGGHTPVIAKNVSGVNEFIEYCRISSGMAPVKFYPSQQKGAEYRFLVFPEGEVKNIVVEKALHDQKQIDDIVLSIKAGDIVKPVRTTSDRAGCVVTHGDTLKDAIDIANQACSQVKVEYTDGNISSALLF